MPAAAINSSMSVDVLVRGAGPVGCVIALALRASHKRIAVLGKAGQPPALRPIVLSYASRLILERVGVWRSLAPTSIETIHVSRARGFGRTVFDAADVGVPALGYVLEYSELLRALHGAVDDLLVGDEVSARCVVHAEGAAPDAEEKRYAQDALVARVRFSAPAGATAFERFTAEGPLALLPLLLALAPLLFTSALLGLAPKTARRVGDDGAEHDVRRVGVHRGHAEYGPHLGHGARVGQEGEKTVAEHAVGRLGPRWHEQQEEAERFKKLAARFGTDPTAIVGRVQLASAYAELPQGGKSVSTVARVDLPFRGNWLLRLDFPFERWNDPNRSGTTSERGLGDLAVTAGWRAYNTPEYAFFLGASSTFPTAAENALGSGKYTVGPFIATARFLPRWESFLFGIFQHQASVGGDPVRRDVELTKVSAQINTIWAERWWTIVQGQWQIDWERSAKSSMTLEFEGGMNLGGRWGIFMRPGVGVWGRDLAGAYEWNIEIGIRRMFGSF